MDLFSKLPFFKSNDEAVAETLSEEEAKAARIKFHRESVRNGPTTFRNVTSGMIRRAQQRDLDRRTRKARRKQVQNYLATQQLAAATRGQLQLAGVLPYVHEQNSYVDPVARTRAAAWLVQRFGVNVEVDGVETDEISFAYHDVLTALGAALKFYGQAVGQTHLQVPADYVVPVYEQGTAPAGVA